jgi:hypothetical protein
MPCPTHFDRIATQWLGAVNVLAAIEEMIVENIRFERVSTVAVGQG